MRDKRGYSSAGRAPALQAGGHRFDPDYLHQLFNSEFGMRNSELNKRGLNDSQKNGLIAQPVRASA